MTVAGTSARVTFDLGDRELYRRLRIAADEEDLTVREIVIEAVQYWLDHREEIENELAARAMDRIAAESSGEYLTHDEVKGRLKEQ
jgi:hypothetical protein